MHNALLAAATSAVQQFTTGSVNPIEEFASVMTAASSLRAGGENTGDDDQMNQRLEAARRQIVEEAMGAMTGVIEKMVTAGGSAAYHRKAYSQSHYIHNSELSTVIEVLSFPDLSRVRLFVRLQWKKLFVEFTMLSL
jgi:hypothetical protein